MKVFGPLHRAAQDGDLAAVERELAAGVDPALLDDTDRPPLTYAIFGKHDEIVARLLPLTPLPLRTATLLVATERGCISANGVKALIAAGVDVNARDAQGRTPLLHATELVGADLDVVEALLALGADATATNAQGQTALQQQQAWWDDAEIGAWMKKHRIAPVIAALGGVVVTPEKKKTKKKRKAR